MSSTFSIFGWVIISFLSAVTVGVCGQPLTVSNLCSTQAPSCRVTNGVLPDYPWTAGCSCLTSVVNLTLSDQGIRRLPPSWGIPGAFPQLQLLNLTNNSIAELPLEWASPGAFPKLVSLWLLLNQIQILPVSWGSAGAFPSLLDLRLRGNLISSLPEAPNGAGFFQTLRNLSISYNELSGPLPASWGRPGALARLERLNLGNNHISLLPPSWGAAGSFPRLSQLSLFNNSISNLPETWGPVGGFPSLQYLDLSGNQLASFPASWESGPVFPALAILFVDKNQLTSLPSNWGGPTAFSFLVLLFAGGNRLSSLPEAWGNPGRFLNLDTLFLENNVITALPDTWTQPGAFPSLSKISLDNNSIASLPAVSASSWRTVFYLSLRGNPVTELPPAWGNPGTFPSLQFLDVGKGRYVSLPASWSSRGAFGALVSLDVSGGALETLPETWFGPGAFPNLAQLHASGNQISVLPEAWGRPPQVCRVFQMYLDNNRLTKLPESWSSNISFPYLFTWNVSRNNIQTLPASYGGPGKFPILYALDVSYNKITSLPSEWGAAGSFRAMQWLNLSGNGITIVPKSWTTFLDNGDDAFQILDELKLADTPSLAGRKLKEVLSGFWTRCIESSPYGCVANFLGSNMSASVSPSLKRSVCFSNITVLLAGPPGYEVPRDTRTDLAEGNDLLPIVAFDRIDLGPGGVHLTGLRFPPRPGNLCRNPHALQILSLIWGVTLGVLLTAMVALAAFHFCYKRFRRTVLGLSHRPVPVAALLYLLGLFGAAAHVVDLVLDALVLRDVWIQQFDTWVKWILLGSLVGHYAIAGLFLSAAWWAARPTGGWIPLDKSQLDLVPKAKRGRWVRLDWWLAAECAFSYEDRPDKVTARDWPFILATWPLAVPAVLVLDVAAILVRCGVHPVLHGKVVTLDPYVTARGLVEVLFEMLPLSVVKTALYWMGNSAATNYYIDDRIFLVSLCVSMTSLLKALVLLFKDSLADGRFAPVEVWYRMRNMRAMSVKANV